MSWMKRKEPLTSPRAHEPSTAGVEEVEEVEEVDAMPVSGIQDSRPRTVAADCGTGATIGATLRIQGELTGHEDVTIDGTLEGRVDVLEHVLTVGPSASVKASIRARCVVIEGHVVGDVTADDKVEITATGSLVGDIRAARVVLAENARFKGSVDMGPTESAPEPVARAERVAPPRPAKEERPPAPPRPAAPAPSGSKLSSLDWDAPAPPPASTKG